MEELIIRDVRLQGGKPLGRFVLEVDANTPIDWPISWASAQARRPELAGNVALKIMAHGFEQRIGDDPMDANVVWGMGGNVRSAPPPRPGTGIYSQGGAGIQFCREYIRLATLNKFTPLRGLLKGIDLMACGAAYITPGFAGTDGDGNLLCYRLAQITQSYVRASTATQLYFTLPTVDFGAWEGTVLSYGPSGAVVKVESGAAAPTGCPVH